MHRAIVMTVIGPDRPGLVELLSQIVADHGGNWLESRMSRLGGQFAGILRVEIPAENENRMSAALQNLQAKGLNVLLQKDEAKAADSDRASALLELVGSDRPGIVREISRALASKNINVEELQTEICSAPMSGEMLFKATAELHLPESCSMDDVRKELEKIAQDLFVDISIRPVTS